MQLPYTAYGNNTKIRGEFHKNPRYLVMICIVPRNSLTLYLPEVRGETLRFRIMIEREFTGNSRDND